MYVVRLRRGVSGVWSDQDLLLEQPDERDESRARGFEGSGKSARPAERGTRYQDLLLEQPEEREEWGTHNHVTRYTQNLEEGVMPQKIKNPPTGVKYPSTRRVVCSAIIPRIARWEHIIEKSQEFAILKFSITV